MSNLRGYDLQLAEGCGKRDVYHWDQSADKWVSLRTRAAFDLGCEREKIQVKVLDAVTYGTTGCDRRATFKYIVLTGFVMNASDESPKGRERQ